MLSERRMQRPISLGYARTNIVNNWVAQCRSVRDANNQQPLSIGCENIGQLLETFSLPAIVQYKSLS